MSKKFINYLKLLTDSVVFFLTVHFLSISVAFFIVNHLFDTEFDTKIKTPEYLIFLCVSLFLCLLLLGFIYNSYQYCGIFAHCLVLLAAYNIGLILGVYNFLLSRFVYGFGLVFVYLWGWYPHYLADFVFLSVLGVLIVNIYWYFF